MSKVNKIIVEVRGGVAYCNDPRVEIIDYDNLEDENKFDFESFKYHSICARATLYPRKTIEEVEAILEQIRGNFVNLK